MNYYKYPFTHHIVFGLVMRDPEICRGVLQTIFPDREIREVRLHEDYLEIEKMIIPGVEAHQVRLDVLFSDSESWYDIEMQARDENDLPKRTRYTHASIDVDNLKPGQEYNTLLPSFVIFICCFDFFGQDKPIYRFSMQEEENHLPLGDESYTIILNSKSSDVTPIGQPLQQLFQYINESIVPEGNPLLEAIDRSVETWNTGEGMRVIMTLEQEILIKENRAREEGREEGRTEERERNMQEKYDTARKLREAGVAPEIIATALDLTINEI